MSDTPETDMLLSEQHHDCVPYDEAAEQLAKLCRKLERERDEARGQEQIHFDNRDEWRKCAEALAELAQHPREGDEFIDDYVALRARAMGAFRRLKEASK